MKQLKLTMLTCLILLTGIGQLNAQTTKSTQEMLCANTWIFDQGERKGATMFKYSDKYETCTFRYNGEEASAVKEYYLSDSIDTTFDKQKVGNVTNGKYIIAYNSKMSEIVIFEIISLTDDEIVLQAIANHATSPVKFTKYLE